MKIDIDTDYYFSDEQKFPWDTLGLTRPVCGSTHSYLSSLLSPFADSVTERHFLQSRPTMRELGRFIRFMEDAHTSRTIVNYCEYIDQESGSVAAKVLRGLGRNGDFVRWAGAHLLSLHRRGEIRIPHYALIVTEEKD